MNSVLFIDIGSDVRDKTNKIVAGLRARGISVCHPENSKALAPSVALGQQSLGQQFDAVVHFDLGIPHRFTSVLEAYELTGVRVMNLQACCIIGLVCVYSYSNTRSGSRVGITVILVVFRPILDSRLSINQLMVILSIWLNAVESILQMNWVFTRS
jgi:hypothetical protein